MNYGTKTAAAKARYEAAAEYKEILLELACQAERAWKKAQEARKQAFTDYGHCLEEGIEWMTDAGPAIVETTTRIDLLCNAEDNKSGPCELPKGHKSRYHQVFHDGELWAEWSG